MFLKEPIFINGQPVSKIQLFTTIASIHNPGEQRSAVGKIVHLVDGESPNSLIPLKDADIEIGLNMDESTPPELIPHMLKISEGIRGLLTALYGYSFEES